MYRTVCTVLACFYYSQYIYSRLGTFLIIGVLLVVFSNSSPIMGKAGLWHLPSVEMPSQVVSSNSACLFNLLFWAHCYRFFLFRANWTGLWELFQFYISTTIHSPVWVFYPHYIPSFSGCFDTKIWYTYTSGNNGQPPTPTRTCQMGVQITSKL